MSTTKVHVEPRSGGSSPSQFTDPGQLTVALPVISTATVLNTLAAGVLVNDKVRAVEADTRKALLLPMSSAPVAEAELRLYWGSWVLSVPHLVLSAASMASKLAFNTPPQVSSYKGSPTAGFSNS